MAGPVGFLSGSERHFTCSAHLDRFISSRVQLTGIAIGDCFPISAPEAMMASAYQWSRGADGGSRRASLQRLDKLATLLDVAFHVPGTSIRFGIEAILRLVPGVGDVAASALSCWILLEAHWFGSPRALLI